MKVLFGGGPVRRQRDRRSKICCRIYSTPFLRLLDILVIYTYVLKTYFSFFNGWETSYLFFFPSSLRRIFLSSFFKKRQERNAYEGSFNLLSTLHQLPPIAHQYHKTPTRRTQDWTIAAKTGGTFLTTFQNTFRQNELPHCLPAARHANSDVCGNRDGEVVELHYLSRK